MLGSANTHNLVFCATVTTLANFFNILSQLGRGEIYFSRDADTLQRSQNGLFSQVWSPGVIKYSYGRHGCWKSSRTNNTSDLCGPISLWSSHVKPFIKRL